MILYYLFTGADDLANFPIAQALPDLTRNSGFGWVETGTRCHGRTIVFASIASQLHALATPTDSGPQEKDMKVLFYGSLTDLQLASDFLIAEAL